MKKKFYIIFPVVVFAVCIVIVLMARERPHKMIFEVSDKTGFITSSTNDVEPMNEKCILSTFNVDKIPVYNYGAPGTQGNEHPHVTRVFSIVTERGLSNIIKDGYQTITKMEVPEKFEVNDIILSYIIFNNNELYQIDFLISSAT